MSKLHLNVPFPPSVNHYWRHITLRGHTRTVISKKGREYRQTIGSLIRPPEPLTGRLSVCIDLQPPDRRRRDIDNYPKALLDSLTHAGVWEDDEQIDSLHITRGKVEKPGAAIVTISEIG